MVWPTEHKSERQAYLGLNPGSAISFLALGPRQVTLSSEPL